MICAIEQNSRLTIGVALRGIVIDLIGKWINAKVQLPERATKRFRSRDTAIVVSIEHFGKTFHKIGIAIGDAIARSGEQRQFSAEVAHAVLSARIVPKEKKTSNEIVFIGIRGRNRVRTKNSGRVRRGKTP